MKKCALFLLFFCTAVALKAQTDTVVAKIRKVPNIKVDVLARFPGGDFANYIAANIVFKKKLDKNLSGQVVLSMKIDSNGRVSNINILKNLTADIDQSITRVVKASPKWKPAILNGKPVAMYMVFNIDMAILGAASAAAAKEKKDNTVPITKPAISPVTKVTSLPPADNKAVINVAKSTPALPNKITLKPPVEKKSTPAGFKATAPTVNKPILKAITKQQPPFDKKPLPVTQKNAAPQIVNKTKKPAEKKTVVVPPVKKPALPVIAKLAAKPGPVAIAKKNTPVPVKKTKPVIVKPEKKKVPDEASIPLGRSAEAEFPNGGMQAFYEYLNRNIRYPVVSKVNRIEGEVNLSFVINTDGAVTDVKILDSPAEDLGQEAVRVLLACPKWKPAMQNGVAIKRSFTVPINFKLQDKSKQR